MSHLPTIYTKEEVEQALAFTIRRLKENGVASADLITILSDGHPFMTAEASLSLQIVEEFLDAH